MDDPTLGAACLNAASRIGCKMSAERERDTSVVRGRPILLVVYIMMRKDIPPLECTADGGHRAGHKPV